MLPGPVFNVELLTTARRKRYFALRFLYGMILLLLVWINYQDPPMVSGRAAGGEMTIQEMAMFADGLFTTFVMVQGVMVLAITPTLVAGVITEEKQRKTLHYLLSSQLTSGEIVLGKLGARMLHLGVFVAIGLPVISLLSLFGGVDPQLVMLAFSATLSTAFFLAAIAIFISTIAQKVREAIAVVYLLEIAWLAIPPILDAMVQFNFPGSYAAFHSVNEWLLAAHPTELVWRMSGRGGALGVGPVLWMIGLQTAYGAILVLLAVWRLRPVFRRQGSAPSGGSGAFARLRRWRFRLLPRPTCGTDPMIWKELHVSRTSGLVKAIGMVVGMVLGGLLMYGVLYWGWEAAKELIAYGYGSLDWDNERNNFNGFLRWSTTVAYVLWLLAVAGTAAGGITSEREGDTWISLLSTPLEPEEILRAKMLGPVWTLRGLGALIVLLWTTGLALGSVHPFGYAMSLIEFSVFTWFAVALGTFISLRSKTTMRAQATTIGILLFTNGGYMLCCAPFQPDTPMIGAGSTPFIQAVSLLSYADVRTIFDWDGSRFRPGLFHQAGEVATACAMGLFAYGAAAWGLTLGAFGVFEQVTDRPRIGTDMWQLADDPGLGVGSAQAEAGAGEL